MSNGTNGETHSPVYERLLYRNDVCLTDCVFLCILSAAFGILWLDLDLGVRVNHIFKLSYIFYIHIVSFSSLFLLLSSLYLTEKTLPRDRCVRECLRCY